MSNKMKLSLKEDDPFLSFFNYSQTQLDKDYETNEFYPVHPLSRHLKKSGSMDQLELPPNIREKISELVMNLPEPELEEDLKHILNDSREFYQQETKQ